ncbi:MAG: AbrB/MazE/SpoVT family DNA-binding domain-containing protein [Gemmatimonadales bacterium]
MPAWQTHSPCLHCKHRPSRRDLTKTRAKLVRIGNSRGIRLPKPLIEQAGLSEDVELDVRNGAIVIRAADGPRAGWADAAAALAARGAGLLDEPTATAFDADWVW